MKWPAGIRSAAFASGIKADGALDLGLIVADSPCAWAGTFTQNAAAAAPVLWSRSRLESPARAVIVNSGNANACTGPDGTAAVNKETYAVAAELGCTPQEVLVASTGPIGIPLPVEKIVAAVSGASGSLDENVDPFAQSILTTDTTTKVARCAGTHASVMGVAKGAAMLAPNMATMLAFLATDASVDAATLQKVLEVAVDRSFNRISVDACESTNDSVFMLATGSASEPTIDDLVIATTKVCQDLAEAMVRDAEGGSRFVCVQVQGAVDESAAVELARAVASSALWRAAVYGGDPNWGRIVSALGSADRSLQLADVTVAINDVAVFEKGVPVVDLIPARDAMATGDITVSCHVGQGPGSADFLTSDLTPDYVTLNAEGST